MKMSAAVLVVYLGLCLLSVLLSYMSYIHPRDRDRISFRGVATFE